MERASPPALAAAALAAMDDALMPPPCRRSGRARMTRPTARPRRPGGRKSQRTTPATSRLLPPLPFFALWGIVAYKLGHSVALRCEGASQYCGGSNDCVSVRLFLKSV
eukprot:scaffold203526_cov28-Tisochrysis_lutea.AAC.1